MPLASARPESENFWKPYKSPFDGLEIYFLMKRSHGVLLTSLRTFDIFIGEMKYFIFQFVKDRIGIR